MSVAQVLQRVKDWDNLPEDCRRSTVECRGIRYIDKVAFAVWSSGGTVVRHVASYQAELKPLLCERFKTLDLGRIELVRVQNQDSGAIGGIGRQSAVAIEAMWPVLKRLSA